jgi:allantoinase
VLEAEDLRTRHAISPYVGRELRARVVRTVLRGRTVAIAGEVAGEPSGRLLKPI